MVELEKSSTSGLGISLAGHKDRNKMAVLICGLNPQGVANKAGILKVGDEILEVSAFDSFSANYVSFALVWCLKT